MDTEEAGHLLTGGGLTTGNQEEGLEALALVAIGLLLEHGFQCISTLGNHRLFTMHAGLL